MWPRSVRRMAVVLAASLVAGLAAAQAPADMTVRLDARNLETFGSHLGVVDFAPIESQVKSLRSFYEASFRELIGGAEQALKAANEDLQRQRVRLSAEEWSRARSAFEARASAFVAVAAENKKISEGILTTQLKLLDARLSKILRDVADQHAVKVIVPRQSLAVQGKSTWVRADFMLLPADITSDPIAGMTEFVRAAPQRDLTDVVMAALNQAPLRPMEFQWKPFP